MKTTKDWKYCIIDWLKLINQLVLEKRLLENTKKWYTKKDYIKYFTRLENILNNIDNTCIKIYWN
jgi:hypothetical protein